jgi:hypothetical protein
MRAISSLDSDSIMFHLLSAVITQALYGYAEIEHGFSQIVRIIAVFVFVFFGREGAIPWKNPPPSRQNKQKIRTDRFYPRNPCSKALRLGIYFQPVSF